MLLRHHDLYSVQRAGQLGGGDEEELGEGLDCFFLLVLCFLRDWVAGCALGEYRSSLRKLKC